MEIVIAVLLGAGAFLLVSVVADRSGGSAFRRAYDKAQQEDLKYFREHPGCSYEEAHMHRDKVMKKYGKY